MHTCIIHNAFIANIDNILINFGKIYNFLINIANIVKFKCYEC